jgi:hypothetical protein
MTDIFNQDSPPSVPKSSDKTASEALQEMLVSQNDAIIKTAGMATFTFLAMTSLLAAVAKKHILTTEEIGMMLSSITQRTVPENISKEVWENAAFYATSLKEVLESFCQGGIEDAMNELTMLLASGRKPS